MINLVLENSFDLLYILILVWLAFAVISVPYVQSVWGTEISLYVKVSHALNANMMLQFAKGEIQALSETHAIHFGLYIIVYYTAISFLV